MDDQDEQLRQLIAAVGQHPQGSIEQRRAINRLLLAIQRLPEFTKYLRPEYPNYFLDALNRTWEWLSRNLHNFKPDTPSVRASLVRWINGYLYWRIKDLAETEPLIKKMACFSLDVIVELDDDSREKITYLEKVGQQGEFIGIPSSSYAISGIEIYLEQYQKQSQQNLIQELEDYIEQDPEGKLRNCYPRNYPKCNCQLLSQRLLFIFKEPPDTLADIAKEFGVNYQTLLSHWKRKAIPLLREILIELGYQPYE